MLTVKELAKIGGTTPHVVRYYSRLGLLSPRRDPRNRYRLYRPRDVKWLQFIRQAKCLGYTLKEIQEIMREAEQGESPCPRVREILQHRVSENRRRLNELMVLQARMELALDQWSQLPDGLPDGDTVCHLIESFSGKSL